MAPCVSLWYLATHETIFQPVQAGLAMAEIEQITMLYSPLWTRGMLLWLEGGQGKWVGSLGLGIGQDTLPGLGQPGGPPPHTVTQTIL